MGAPHRSPQITPLLVIAVLTVTLFVGCSGTPVPKDSKTANDSDAPRMDNLELISAQRVFLVRPGRDQTDKHVGYVVEQVQVVNGEDTNRVFMAWDEHYGKQIGFFLDNGATYVIGPEGTQMVGNYGIQRRLATIYGESGTYRLTEK